MTRMSLDCTNSLRTLQSPEPFEIQTFNVAAQGLVPVLGVDVWEHAYYKQYNNLRPVYLQNIWKIINWKDVDERLRSAKA